MATIRVGFLGAKHPHVFPRLALCEGDPRVEVVGIYDSDPRIRAELDLRGHGPVSADLAGVIAGADAVVVEGFDPENPDLVRSALPHVRGILLEKPGAPTAAAMDALAAEAARYPVHVRIGYMLQHSPVWTPLRRIVDSGVLGAVTLARFHAATPVGCSAEIWQSLPADEGGLLWTDGCHMMRAALELFGLPEQVTGSVRRLPTGPRVVADSFKSDVFGGLGGPAEFGIGELVHEDCAAAILSYPGTLAIFDITAWEAHGWVEAWRIELYGADATLTAGLNPAWYHLDVRRGHSDYKIGTTREELGTPVASAETSLIVDDCYSAEMAAFLDAVESGDTDQSELAAGRATLDILHAVYASSRSGQTQGVPGSDSNVEARRG